MKLSSLLNQSLIFFNLEGADRSELYTNLLTKMSKMVKLPVSPAVAAKEMIEREDAYGIIYDSGFAFPHMRHPDLQDLDIGIGILKKPVRLKPDDKTPTKLIVCCMISETTSVIYLKSLAAFSKYFLSNPGALDKLTASGTPKDFLDILTQDKVEVKHTLTAEDVMLKNPRFVRPEDTLSSALDVLSEEQRMEIPVLDENGVLKGVISCGDIIRRAIPEYIMMLENLTFLNQFEPFENLLKEERKLLVKDVMSEPKHTVATDVPLFQLTVNIVKNSLPSLMVVDKQQKLCGIITYIELVTNVLRG